MESEYQKIIQIGQFIEVYNYEKAPAPYRGRKKKSNRGDYKTIRKRRVDNLYRQRKAFKRLVRANFTGIETPLLITFTHANVIGLVEGNKNLRVFIKRLRRLFGETFRYIAVPEFQKRGSVHFHTLFWGLPEDLAKKERQTRQIAKMWGYGYVDIILTDGHLKLVGYLSKYMGKSLSDVRLGGKKAYTSSRNIKRPVIHKNSIIDTYSKELWGIDLSTDEGLQERYFDTDWLGKCCYKLYKIKND